MTRNGYALIGRSHPSETFELLYRNSVAARAERRRLARTCDTDGAPAARRWRGSGEPITLPPRLRR